MSTRHWVSMWRGSIRSWVCLMRCHTVSQAQISRNCEVEKCFTHFEGKRYALHLLLMASVGCMHCTGVVNGSPSGSIQIESVCKSLPTHCTTPLY